MTWMRAMVDVTFEERVGLSDTESCGRRKEMKQEIYLTASAFIKQPYHGTRVLIPKPCRFRDAINFGCGDDAV